MLLICFQCCMGRCYCPVVDAMATFCIFVMADVIAQWQMEWPLQCVSVSLLVDEHQKNTTLKMHSQDVNTLHG